MENSTPPNAFPAGNNGSPSNSPLGNSAHPNAFPAGNNDYSSNPPIPHSTHSNTLPAGSNGYPSNPPIDNPTSPNTFSDRNGDSSSNPPRLETGVTLADIARFIEGPDLMDGRWTCTYQGCNKKFGRRENIRSHVQTHLGDRQYQCPTCRKCFVRQHDLKRHAKIHTGTKEYPCDCGHAFARHDALTRHRQRGMCVGAIEGSVRKNAKRGRPRKPRPDMNERQEKSAKTRHKNNMSISSVSSTAPRHRNNMSISSVSSTAPRHRNNMSISSVSSTALSIYTDSSVGTPFSAGTPFDPASSPADVLNMVDDIDNMIDLSGAIGQYDNSASSSAPMPNITRPVISPAQSVEPMPSPSTASLHSCVSPRAVMDPTPPHLSSPTASDRSRLHTPQPDPLSTQSSQEPEAAFLPVTPEEFPINFTPESSEFAYTGPQQFVDYSQLDMRPYTFLPVEPIDKFDGFFIPEDNTFDSGSGDALFPPNDY